jgi:Cupin
MYIEPHYHSTTHETLVVFRGTARLRFGVSDSDSTASAVEIEVKVGDLLVIPAGVAHCAWRESGGFCMVGAYPDVCAARGKGVMVGCAALGYVLWWGWGSEGSQGEGCEGGGSEEGSCGGRGWAVEGVLEAGLTEIRRWVHFYACWYRYSNIEAAFQER